MDTEIPATKNQIPNTGRWKRLWLSFGIYAAVILVLGSYLGGVAVGRKQQAEESGKTGRLVGDKDTVPGYVSKDVDMAQFWEIWDTVKNHYLRKPVTDPELFYGSLKGLVAALGDPYSSYFDPDEAASFASQLNGTFEGIGAEIGYKDSQLTIIAPLPDTPAAKSGLKAGDAILKIDGTDTSGMAIDIAVAKIRGQKGTTVILNVYREEINEPFDVSIVRDKIVVDSVKAKMVDEGGRETDASGGVGVITVSEFNQDTVREFDAALRTLLLRDARGVIIDLRDNPGGYLDAAVELPRAWTGDRPVVIQRRSDGGEEAMSPTLKPMSVDLPTVVLVNRWSASAAEIVAGAMQDYGQATLVGETTFGKGSVQEYVDNFSDGSALKLTVAEWLTPLKRLIDKKGIEPDVKVELTAEDDKAGRDPQLAKALEIVTKKEHATAKE